MATSSHVFFLLSLAGVPNGYVAVGYLLFLQEQIKGIIIIDTVRMKRAALSYSRAGACSCAGAGLRIRFRLH